MRGRGGTNPSERQTDRQTKLRGRDSSSESERHTDRKKGEREGW